MYPRIGLSCPAEMSRHVIGQEVESAHLPLVGLRAVVTMVLTIRLLDQMTLDSLLLFGIEIGELSMLSGKGRPEGPLTVVLQQIGESLMSEIEAGDPWTIAVGMVEEWTAEKEIREWTPIVATETSILGDPDLLRRLYLWIPADEGAGVTVTAVLIVATRVAAALGLHQGKRVVAVAVVAGVAASQTIAVAAILMEGKISAADCPNPDVSKGELMELSRNSC